MYILLTLEPHHFRHTFNDQTQLKTLKQTLLSLVNVHISIREGENFPNGIQSINTLTASFQMFFIF